jgi:fluoroquinolone transport system permease protein
VFLLLYIGLIFALPVAWRKTAGILMIFTDPAAMGLYFMGAIVLFEKSERVLNSISISPVKPLEYMLSKLCSLAVISTVVANISTLNEFIIATIPAELLINIPAIAYLFGYKKN